jgi:hypothetical protein
MIFFEIIARRRLAFNGILILNKKNGAKLFLINLKILKNTKQNKGQNLISAFINNQ